MKKNNEEQDRDLEAAVNLIKHIRNFYEAIPPVMQQMCCLLYTTPSPRDS